MCNHKDNIIADMDENVKKFIDDLIKQEFLVFAGTGIVAEGVPKSWKSLLEKLAIEANYEIDLDNISKNQYPDEAQKIFEYLAQVDKKEKYYEIIKNALALKETSWDQKAFDILDTTKSRPRQHITQPLLFPAVRYYFYLNQGLELTTLRKQQLAQSPLTAVDGFGSILFYFTA